MRLTRSCATRRRRIVRLMGYCGSCGASRPHAASFCPSCGAPFDQDAPGEPVEANRAPERGGLRSFLSLLLLAVGLGVGSGIGGTLGLVTEQGRVGLVTALGAIGGAGLGLYVAQVMLMARGGDSEDARQ
jgi:hypothetical protein